VALDTPVRAAALDEAPRLSVTARRVNETGPRGRGWPVPHSCATIPPCKPRRARAGGGRRTRRLSV